MRLILILLFASVAVSARAQKPNIVLVVVDDLGWADLTCQGSTYFETPNIDRLASGGMRFTDAYAACAVCSPTRAAVMTGRYPARLGLTDWMRPSWRRAGKNPKENPTEYVGGANRQLLCPPNPFWMEADEVTIAEVLRGAGYATCHIGKWHLGHDNRAPTGQGFAENFGGWDLGQPPSYFDPYKNKRLPGIPTLAPRDEGEYLTDREGDEAVAFIERNKERPFFLHLAHYAVHTPIQAKPALTAHYDAKPKTRQKNAKYAAMVHSVDDAMGKVSAALNACGVQDRTYIIFTSDNGGLLGPTHNAPLRSGKGFSYEGGVRVPLIVKGPGIAEHGTSSAIATSVDYFPTILELTGVPRPEGRALDGVSLATHLKTNAAIERDAVFWHFPHYRGANVTPYSIVRSGKFKLIKRYEGPTFELFNLDDDLGETTDLSEKHPEVVKQLHGILAAHLKELGAKLPRKNPDYRAPAAEGSARDSSLPRVLILGDSISIGYTREVGKVLTKEANVFRPTRNNGKNAENCQGTNHGVRRIDAWIAAHGGKWDVIHFNFGLHDLKRVKADTGKNSNDPNDPYQAAPELYRKQLTEIVTKLEKTGAKLIFATTTPVPQGVRPYRATDDPKIYNQIARAIMGDHKIPVNDLFAFAEPRLDELQKNADVHFKPKGSKALARQVARSVRRALRRR